MYVILIIWQALHRSLSVTQQTLTGAEDVHVIITDRNNDWNIYVECGRTRGDGESNQSFVLVPYHQTTHSFISRHRDSSVHPNRDESEPGINNNNNKSLEIFCWWSRLLIKLRLFNNQLKVSYSLLKMKLVPVEHWTTDTCCFLPGALTECYDELGNRYQLPVYCLSPPVNMIEERSEELDGSDPDSGAADPSSGSASDPASGGECQLRLRLSTGRDLRLAVRSTDTVGMMKRRLQSHEGVPAATQRWFFSGRPLTDRLRLDQLNISRDYVVQVILSQPPPPEPVSTPGHTPEASGPVTVEAVAALPQEPMPVEN